MEGEPRPSAYARHARSCRWKRRGKGSREEAWEELKLLDLEQRGVAHPGEHAVGGLELGEVHLPQAPGRLELQEDAWSGLGLGLGSGLGSGLGLGLGQG